MAIDSIDPNTTTPSAITTGLIVVSVIFPILSAFSIYLRYLARRKTQLVVFADDAWVLVAWIFTFTLSVLVWVFTDKSGINYYKIDAQHGTMYSLELIFLTSCLIQFPLATVKISILLFYKRIFASSKPFRVAVWIAIGVVTVWCWLFFGLVLTQVDPISASWTGGRLRYDSVTLGLAQVGSSIALDFVVLCFPLPVISRLHMAAKRKLAVSLIFWLGAFCCVAAIVRTVLLNESVRAVVQNQSNVFGQSKQFIFMIIEPNCSIIAACLPCYGPLLAGGRRPESIIRSIRSLISIGSGGSKHSLRDRSNAAKVPSGPNDSQIELGIQSWPGKGKQDVQIVGGKVSQDTDTPSIWKPEGNAINVTSGVSVQRQ